VPRKATVEITWDHLRAALEKKTWGSPGMSIPEAVLRAVQAAEVQLPEWSFTLQSQTSRMSAAGVNVAAVTRLVQEHIESGDLVQLTADEYRQQLGNHAPGVRGSQRCVLLASQYDDMVVQARRKRHDKNVKRLRDEAEAEVLARHHEEVERLLAAKLANYSTLNVAQA